LQQFDDVLARLFDNADHWANGLPASGLSTVVHGALLQVRQNWIQRYPTAMLGATGTTGSFTALDIPNPKWSKWSAYGWKCSLCTSSGATAMAPLGDGFVVGQADGTVNVWTGSQWAELPQPIVTYPQGLTAKDFPQPTVTSILTHQTGGFVVGRNDGSVQMWDGSKWTEVQQPGTFGGNSLNAGSYVQVTGIVPEGNGPDFLVSVNEAPGSIPAVEDSDLSVSTCGTEGCTTDGYKGQAFKKVKSVGPAIPYNGGLVIGRNDTVQQWSRSSGWTQLGRDFGYFRKIYNQTPTYHTVDVVIPYGTGLVAGLYNGQVVQWDGSSWETMDSLGSSVTAMMPYDAGFIVGLDDGRVWYWNPCENCRSNERGFVSLTSVSSISDSAVNAAIPYGDGFVLALADGSVQQWTGPAKMVNSWAKMQGSVWGEQPDYEPLIALADGTFAVGLTNGVVQLWRPWTSAATLGAMGS
jgi:hypothetical protein